MAKQYQAPIDAPEFNVETYEADEEKYIADLRKWLTDNGYTGKYVGETVQFPYADGYAVYMIASLKPATLVHVPIGDAWHLPAAHIRGLTAKELKAQVDNTKALQAVFGKK